MPDADAPRPALDRAVEVVTRRSILVSAAAVIVIAVAVVALLGGFADADPADAERVPELPVGEWSQTRPYSVAILGATRTGEYGYTEAEPGEELILVELDAVNTWDRQTSRLRDTLLLDLGDGEPLTPERTVVVADGTETGGLPPRVTTRLIMLWTVPVGAVGETATLQAVDATLITEGRLITNPYWTRDRVAQLATVPVVDDPAREDGS